MTVEVCIIHLFQSLWNDSRFRFSPFTVEEVTQNLIQNVKVITGCEVEVKLMALPDRVAMCVSDVKFSENGKTFTEIINGLYSKYCNYPMTEVVLSIIKHEFQREVHKQNGCLECVPIMEVDYATHQLKVEDVKVQVM